MKRIIFILIVILFQTICIYCQHSNGPTPITATEVNPYGGGYSKALIYFDYAGSNTNIIKPLIVFEGYDPGYYTKPKEKEGRTGIYNFIDDISDGQTGAAYSNLFPLLQGSAQQYDIIYVNWKNGTDYLENNEKVAKKVIMEVNRLKAESGSTEPNVIIGRSMGAVIARMALRHMEDEFVLNDPDHPRHDTRLLISNDGGMQGSNIPEGYQYMVNHFRDQYIASGPLAMFIEGSTNVTNFFPEYLNMGSRVGSPLMSLSVNETPASRQLSINHVNPANNIDNSLHNSFLASLNNLGYPVGDGNQAFKMIAVSNGSECAKPQDVGSGGVLMNYVGRISPTAFGQITSITAVAVAAPYASPPIAAFGSLPGRNDFNLNLKVNAKADNQANEVYKGTLTYSKKVLGFIPVQVNIMSRTKNAASSSTLAYDYFPGGNQDLSTELGLPESGDAFLLERNISFSHQEYCHVPVPSALDIGKGAVTLTKADYFTPYRGATPPITPKNTAFTDGFITAFNGSPDNEGHTQIERRNGDWMAGWLDGTPASPPSCELACSGVPPVISGPASMCYGTQYTYSLSGLPANTIFTWPASGYYTVTGTGSSVSITPSLGANGYTSVSVSLSQPGCSTAIPAIKSVHIGPPYSTYTIETYPQAEPSCFSVGGIWEFRAVLASGTMASAYEWGYRINGIETIYPFDSQYFTLIPDQSGDTKYLCGPKTNVG